MSKRQGNEPTPLIKPLPKATEVPLADLGPLIEPIKAISKITQAPSALALQGVLTAISIAAQAHADVETLFGTAPIGLFLFSVAESSARKSSVDRLAMQAIRDFENPLMRRFADQLAKFEEADKRNGYRQDQYPVLDDDRVAGREVPATRPISPKISFDDMTYEGLVRHLEFGQPSIGLSSDEGGKIVGGYAMAAPNQLAFAAAFSNLWDGKDINKVRATSGSLNLAGRRLSVHLSIQPRIAQKLFSNEEIRDQGLLSRILVVMPDNLKGTRFLREDEESLAQRQSAEVSLRAYCDRIRALLEKRPIVAQNDPQELTPPTLKLDPVARKRLVDFYNVVESRQSENGLYSNISGFAGKAAEQACRIAGNIALFEDPDAKAITVDHIGVAITLMLFYLDEALRIFDTGHVSEKLQNAETLREWLSQRYQEDHVDLSEISKCGPNKLRSTPQTKELMRLLEEHGHLEKADGQVQIKGRISHKAFKVIRS